MALAEAKLRLSVRGGAHLRPRSESSLPMAGLSTVSRSDFWTNRAHSWKSEKLAAGRVLPRTKPRTNTFEGCFGLMHQALGCRVQSTGAAFKSCGRRRTCRICNLFPAMFSPTSGLPWGFRLPALRRSESNGGSTLHMRICTHLQENYGVGPARGL